MSHILLLHSALGLRPAVTGFADRLRALGHTVDIPDYYEGRVFQDEQAGIAYRDEVGTKELLARVTPHLSSLPGDAVLAGFSLGSAFAQHLARRRPDAAAVILMHSVAPPQGPWPGQPVQVHRYEHDSWIDTADVTQLGAAVRRSGATFADHVVPGRGHLFTDLDGPDGSVAATEATISMIDELLGAEPGPAG